MKRYAWFRPSRSRSLFRFFGFDPSLRRPGSIRLSFAACFNLPRALASCWLSSSSELFMAPFVFWPVSVAFGDSFSVSSSAAFIAPKQIIDPHPRGQPSDAARVSRLLQIGRKLFLVDDAFIFQELRSSPALRLRASSDENKS